ncbi:MAG: ribonuclease HI [Sphaerochaetaceae bacterium]|jgi:ribonuclease HI|nr:ribonuclease HI [Sphaerochaetaceae bacterium]MDD3163007.1 ribonuclease HI [Sphaerochaetaceae bacterium]MDD4007267.1 ribonuclease HI [Sphaerochaetaceae bacterium]MDD4396201.1 ribonuclease HI [Sphaerochaetaceae bacterium]
MGTVTIYTDGGCSGNPGPGGWAFVVLSADGKMIASRSGGEAHTTNNRMELRAVISAIEAQESMGFEKATICTDSQYVKNGITDWINRWKRNGWVNSKKEAVKNRELWEELDLMVSKHEVDFCWVKGHAGIKYNEMCDQMVRSEMEKFL